MTKYRTVSKSETQCLLCSLCALLLYVDTARLSAQSTTPQEPQCFSIHVRLNGNPVEGPQAITLKTKQSESTASLEGGCFRVPPALRAEKTLGISFTIPGNKIDIPVIATGFFNCSWDIELEDKKFGSDVALPKHFRARQGCAVVFHTGEPETGLSVMPCRTPLPATAKKPVAQNTGTMDPATGNLRITISLVAVAKREAQSSAF